jgi:hypothetical protein
VLPPALRTCRQRSALSAGARTREPLAARRSSPTTRPQLLQMTTALQLHTGRAGLASGAPEASVALARSAVRAAASSAGTAAQQSVAFAPSLSVRVGTSEDGAIDCASFREAARWLACA